MKAIFGAIWDVFRLKRGPEAFPKSWIALSAVSLLYFITDATLFWAKGVHGRDILVQTAFDMALQAGFFALLMSVKLLLVRLNTSLLAWFGASAILNVLDIPLALAFQHEQAPMAQSFLLVPQAALILWSMLVMAQVFRYALDLRLRVLEVDFGFALAFVVAAVYTAVSFKIFTELFPT